MSTYATVQVRNAGVWVARQLSDERHVSDRMRKFEHIPWLVNEFGSVGDCEFGSS